MTELRIVPECHVDTKVAELVGQSSKKYNHQHGCTNVASHLKNELKDKIALGIIDEDKRKGPPPEYFSEFHVLKQENNLILKKHKERKQYLILICPEIEKWLMNDANSVNVSLEEYGLPNSLSGFTKLSKIQSIDKNEGFHRFIKALIRENAPSITTLKKWIELFNKNELGASSV